jgi:hypothetical protein
MVEGRLRSRTCKKELQHPRGLGDGSMSWNSESTAT